MNRSEPRLSMLWETVDPAVTLTERFGFADGASALDWLGQTLRDSWGIAVADCDRLVMSSGNVLAWLTADGRPLIAKWSVVPERFRRLADTATLTAWLDARGVPVAAPLPARDGRLRVELDGVSLGLQPVLDGELLEVSDPTQVTDAGHMLATLHEDLANYPHPIDGVQSTGPEQFVQNDFRSANVLHDGTRITAVLDFEDATCRTRVADLAQATVLLGTRYQGWGPTSPFVRDAFIDAYRETIPLTSGESRELDVRIAAVLARFGWS